MASSFLTPARPQKRKNPEYSQSHTSGRSGRSTRRPDSQDTPGTLSALDESPVDSIHGRRNQSLTSSLPNQRRNFRDGASDGSGDDELEYGHRDRSPRNDRNLRGNDKATQNDGPTHEDNANEHQEDEPDGSEHEITITA
jgi:hypothetical protein